MYNLINNEELTNDIMMLMAGFRVASMVAEVPKDVRKRRKYKMKIHKISKFDKLIENFNKDVKNIEVPKLLYHATYKPLLKKIMQTGLGGNTRKNWEDSVLGTVYLAYDQHQAESYAETSDMVPESWLDQIVILQVNTHGLDKSLFNIDQNNLSRDTLEYKGIIPISNIKQL